MLYRGRSEEREIQRLCQAVRRHLHAAGFISAAVVATQPELCGYVTGLIHISAERASRTIQFQHRLAHRSYVEIFGDSCEAVEFLTLAPQLQLDPTFLEGYKLASADLASPDTEAMAARRIATWTRDSA